MGCQRRPADDPHGPCDVFFFCPSDVYPSPYPGGGVCVACPVTETKRIALSFTAYRLDTTVKSVKYLQFIIIMLYSMDKVHIAMIT